MATSSLESQSPHRDAPSPPPGRGQEAPKPWVGATPDTPRLTLGPGGPTRPAAPGNPVAPWGRRGERWLRCDILGLPFPQPPAHPPDTHGGTLSTAGSFGTSYTSGTLGRREKRVGNVPGGAAMPAAGPCRGHAPNFVPQIWGLYPPGGRVRPRDLGDRERRRHPSARALLARLWHRVVRRHPAPGGGKVATVSMERMLDACRGGDRAKYSPGGRQIQQGRGHRARHARPIWDRCRG